MGALRWAHVEMRGTQAEQCVDETCVICASLDCPYGHGHHYAVDGCPACAEEEAS